MFVLPALLVGFFAMPIIFWSFVLVSLGCLFWALEKETFWASTLMFLAVAFLAFTKFTVGPTMVFDLKLFGEIVAAMLVGNAVIGIFWSYFKWNLYVGDRITLIKNKIEEFGKDEAAKHLVGYYNEGYMNQHDMLASNFKCLTPQARANKKRITMWMIYCIPSMVWFLLNDPIRRFANWAFEQIKEAFQGKADEKFNKAFN